MQIVFYAAFTWSNISFKNEFSDVESNLIEIAPSIRICRLGLIEVALMKFVEVRLIVSFSPKMNRPSMMSSKKLLSLLESDEIKLISFDL
jgi:hypothetical protein